MGNFWKRHKLHILWGAGAIALALLAAVLGSMLLRADRMPADVAVADRPFQGVNLTPVPLKPSDSAAEAASTGGTGEGEGSGQEPQEQPEQKPQETPETPKQEESDGGDKDKEKDDAPADEDKKDDEKPRMQVVTDLTNKTIAFEELENGKFSFYAYLENPEEGAYLQVRLGNTRYSGSNGRFTVTLAQAVTVAISGATVTPEVKVEKDGTASIDGTVVAGTGAVYEPEEDTSEGAGTGDTDAATSTDTAAADKEAHDTPAGETHTALWLALAAVVIACAVLLIVKRKGATK